MLNNLAIANRATTLAQPACSFLPLSGLRGWYDANVKVLKSDCPIVPAEDESSVAVWKDITGNGNDLIAFSNKPVFKKNHLSKQNYIRFNGVNTCMQSKKLFQQSADGDCSAFIIFKMEPNQTGLGINRLLSLELDNTNTNRLWIGESNNCLQIGIGNSLKLFSKRCIADGKVKLLTVIRTGKDSGTVKAYANNELVIESSWKASNSLIIEEGPFQIGGDEANGFLNGDIGEVMIYGSALNEEQLRSVKNYFFAKWEING